MNSQFKLNASRSKISTNSCGNNNRKYLRNLAIDDKNAAGDSDMKKIPPIY